MFSMRITPPTGSNRTVQLNFPQETTRSMLLHNMRTILSKHTTNSCLLRFLKLQLQKMFANCFRTKIKPGSPLTTPIKPSSWSTKSNKTNASLWPSMRMQSKTIRIMMPPTRILMWMHSDHNVHSNSNSAKNRATTVEINPTKATTTTTDHRRTKAPTLPEMVNSVSAARS
jgi:hypothetical protein